MLHLESSAMEVAWLPHHELPILLGEADGAQLLSESFLFCRVELRNVGWQLRAVAINCWDSACGRCCPVLLLDYLWHRLGPLLTLRLILADCVIFLKVDTSGVHDFVIMT